MRKSHTPPRGQVTRGRTIVAVTAALFMGVLSTLAIVSPASAADEPTVDIDKNTGLIASGDTVRITGRNFIPGGLRVNLCQVVTTPGAPPCDTTQATPATVGADGTFTHDLRVKAKFTGNGNPVDCRAAGTECAILTGSVANPRDTTQNKRITVSFAPDAPSIVVSKTSNLVAAGETITITGKEFVPGGLRVNLCKVVTAGGAPPCDTTQATPATVDADGNFTHNLLVKAKFTGSGNAIDCRDAGTECAILTGSVANPRDTTQNKRVTVTFAPDPPPSLSANRTTNLVASGDTITVKGENYKPNVPFHVILCDTTVSAGGSCNYDNPHQATSDANGKFTVAVKVKAKFDGKDCRTTAGVRCGIQTSRMDMPSDRTQEAILPVSFAADPVVTPPRPPVVVPNLVVSKTTGLSAATGGSVVRVTGRNHARNTKLVVALCVTKAAPGKKCDTGTDKVVKTNASGQFSTALKVRAKSGKRKKAINCVTTSCSVKVWRKGKVKDASQRRQVAVHFAGSNVRAAAAVTRAVVAPATGPLVNSRKMVTNASGATLNVSKTSGLNPAGETLTVKGSGFQPNIKLFLVQCDTNVPAGGACDMGRFKQPATDASGAFTATVSVVGKFDKVDCMGGAKCAIQTSKVGDGGDRTQEVTVPLSYSVGAAAAPGTTSSGGKTSSGKSSSSKSGTSTGSATATPQSTSTSTAGLPAMGAPALALPMGLGLLMMATGLFMVRRVRQQG